jgi:hypothetical protein
MRHERERHGFSRAEMVLRAASLGPEVRTSAAKVASDFRFYGTAEVMPFLPLLNRFGLPQRRDVRTQLPFPGANV